MQTTNMHNALTTTTLNKVPIFLWHKRIGHLNDLAINHLDNNELIHVSNWRKAENV